MPFPYLIYHESLTLSESGISITQPGKLASLLNFNTSDDVGGVWRDEELAALCAHQLLAPLEADLDMSDIVADDEDASTFRDFLMSPRPDFGVLVRAKDYFKRQGQNRDSGLPANLAAVFYLACISTALVQLNQRISDSTDESVVKKIRWACGLPWVDAMIVELLPQAEAFLSSK